MKRFLIYILCLMAVAQASAATETPVAEPHRDVLVHWEVGNNAYANGDYARAIEEYRAILDGGEYSAALYYNIANAYFKVGDIGDAILFYHRALRLAPADKHIRQNLELVESKTQDDIKAVPEFFLSRWLRTVRNTMSCTVWSVLSIVAFALMTIFALVFFLAQRIATRKAGFYGALLALLFFVATTSFAVSARNEILTHDMAVVLSSAVSVKSSPDQSATERFVLHEGTTLRVTSSWNDWYEVVIADGKNGWVEAKHIEKI